MNRITKGVLSTALLLIATVVVLYFNFERAEAKGEMYKVGSENIILGAEGNSKVGAYPNPLLVDEADREIVLAYTCIGKDVLFNEVLPGFYQYWYDRTGEKVRFITGMNALGRDNVATKVFDKPAEVSIASSINNLQTRGYDPSAWEKTRNRGIVYGYPWVLVVPKENPFYIQGYEDLLRPNIRIAHVHPLGNHGGMWSVFSLYGNALKRSEINKGKKDPVEAEKFLSQIEETSVYGYSGVGTADLLVQGKADVLIAPEPLARNTITKHPEFTMILPSNTMVTENTVFTMKRNIPNDDKKLIDAFVDFLFTEKIQEAYARKGYRPSDADVLSNHPEFGNLVEPFGMDYLGDATQVKKDILLDKWVNIRNGMNPKWEKLKVTKLPAEKISKEVLSMEPVDTEQ